MSGGSPDYGDLVEDETPGELREIEIPRGFEAGGLARVSDEDERPEDRLHLTRWLLALTTILTVAVGAIALWAPAEVWQRLTPQIAFLLTPFHTLLGIAIGYFFAERRRR